LTGDLGVLDESGALRITGRVKTLIEVGGMKVNPLEVEHTLNRHPGVAECVVVASLVSQTLSRMTVYFVPADASDPPSAAELRRFAKESLAPYKVPRVFKAIDQLPRSSLGKVQRASLAGAGHG
jgi:acyl-coenzyme A synthetase/AMP-(fatty) acid ligase